MPEPLSGLSPEERDALGRVNHQVWVETMNHPSVQAYYYVHDDGRELFRRQAEAVAAHVLGRLVRTLDEQAEGIPLSMRDAEACGLEDGLNLAIREAVAILYPDATTNDDTFREAKQRLLANS